ncbi:hypothetical protein GCM10009675_12440 [Prauserella alba]|uniref:Secreted protein n=1 Tax=Prauserella alba TaxID=176898 RepID=A0ABN1V7K7_9PSEU
MAVAARRFGPVGVAVVAQLGGVAGVTEGAHVTVGCVLVVPFGLGGTLARAAGVAGHPAFADLLFDADLPAQVREVADESDVDGAVQPPQHRQHGRGDDRAHDGRDQQQQHDPLAVRVLGARVHLGGLRVEPASARAVGPRCGLATTACAGLVEVGLTRVGTAGVPALPAVRRLVGLAGLVVVIVVVVDAGDSVVLGVAVGVAVGVVDGVVELVVPTATTGAGVPGHGELPSPVVARTAPHDPARQRRIAGLCDLLALPRHHGNENDKPRSGEPDNDQRAWHLPSPPDLSVVRVAAQPSGRPTPRCPQSALSPR